MTTPSTNRPAATTSHLIEACWLACAAVIPLALAPDTAMLGFIQVPKVFLLRSAALLIAILAVVEWARQAGDDAPTKPWSGLSAAWVRAIPGRLRANPIVAATAAVVLATIISVALSPIPAVSFSGIEPGWDTYGLLSLMAYVVLFGAVATRLRTREQVERLLWAVAVSSMAVSLYGLGQRFGIDIFRARDAVPRVELASGNPIFAAAYLLMTVPVTLALVQIKAQVKGREWTRLRLTLIGAAVISPHMAAIAFTSSRGPTLGLLVAGVTFVGIIAWVYGRRSAMVPGASMLIAIAIGFAMTYVPVPNNPDASGLLASRLASIPGEFGGGLGSRYSIWSAASEAFFSAPWADTDRYPELPELTVRPLRPLVGFGPDMFGYTYNMVGDPKLQSPPGHGHNFIVHTAIELGVLGVLAYGALVGFVAWALWGMLKSARRGEAPLWATYLAIALSSVLVGRAVEQMAGKAQTSDIALSWVFAGVVVALLRMQGTGWTDGGLASGRAPSPAPQRRRSRVSAPAARGLLRSDPARLAVTAVVIVGAAVVWWQAILGPVYAAMLAGGSPTASQVERAIEVSPGSYVVRSIQANNWLNSMRSQTTEPRMLEALGNGLDILQPALDRDPLNGRAWLLRGEMTRAMASINPAAEGVAVRDWEIVVAILPGLWGTHELFAWTLATVGKSERALEVVERARELGAPVDSGSFFLWYVEALALIDLDRDAEADVLIDALRTSGRRNVEVLIDHLRTTAAE